MNYTPLPDMLVDSQFSAHPKATNDDSGHKPLIIGSIIILGIVIIALAFSIFKPKTVLPPTSNVTPTEFQNDTKNDIDVIEELPTPTERIILLETPTDSTATAGLDKTTTVQDPSEVTTASESVNKPLTTPIDTSSTFPTLPSAGLSMSIVTIAFLSGFVILVGFVL